MMPTAAEFKALAEDADPLRLVIRGHQAIESALNTCISEVLPDPHALEIERLSFALKVDLGVALRVVPPDTRTTLQVFNKLRNAFAHKRNPEFSEAKALDLVHTLSTRQRDALQHAFKQPPDQFSAPIDLVRKVLVLLYVELRQRVVHLQEEKLENEALSEILHETAESIRLKGDVREGATEAEVRARVERKRKERESRSGSEGGTA